MLSLEPIGVARTPFTELADAPRQPRTNDPLAARDGRIELFEGRGFEDALADLASWDHVWVIWWFDRSTGWSPKVLPPRSAVKRGVFATRAPHRPNPIGISALRLLRIDGLVLHVDDVDLLDGTPVLDIKPYVPAVDAIPQASSGWLASPRDAGPRYDVIISALASEQLEHLRAAGVDLEPRIRTALSAGPEPHAYRRIRRDPDADTFTLAVKKWRVKFRVDAARVEVQRVTTGYRPSQLFGDPDPSLEIHRAFVARYGV